MSLENLSLEARDELASLAQTMAEDPKTREAFLRLTQQVKPDLQIPEIQIKDSTRAEINKIREENSALQAKMRERDAIEELSKRRNSLVKKGLIDSEDEVKDVEKLMLERGITNHETAAEYHNWMKQAAKPTPSGYNPSAINNFDLKAYWKNPVNAARNEAAKALNELRNPRGQRPIGLG